MSVEKGAYLSSSWLALAGNYTTLREIGAKNSWGNSEQYFLLLTHCHDTQQGNLNVKRIYSFLFLYLHRLISSLYLMLMIWVTSCCPLGAIREVAKRKSHGVSIFITSYFCVYLRQMSFSGCVRMEGKGFLSTSNNNERKH